MKQRRRTRLQIEAEERIVSEAVREIMQRAIVEAQFGIRLATGAEITAFKAALHATIEKGKEQGDETA